MLAGRLNRIDQGGLSATMAGCGVAFRYLNYSGNRARIINERDRYKILSLNSERDNDDSLGLAQNVFALASSL
jgi:hypothetical protein